jgi:hypothetical protein
MHGPWLDAPLWRSYTENYGGRGGFDILPPFRYLGYVNRLIGPVNPAEWGDSYPPGAIDVEYESTVGSDPPGGPQVAIGYFADELNPGSLRVDVRCASRDDPGPLGDFSGFGAVVEGSPVIASFGYPPGPIFLTEVAVAYGPYLWGVTATDYIADPLSTSWNGFDLSIAWIYQPPRYRFIFGGVPPLHQRQRTDGIGGGPATARALASRQHGLHQRGIL